MVSFLPKPELPETCLRLIEALRESGLPGELSDHEWMAQRIYHFAEQLGEGTQTDYLADLLLTGLLLERGCNPAKSKKLSERNFPDHYLRAVPPLLKVGCPPSSWRLVEKGVLVYEGQVWGNEGRWVIKGQTLKPLLDEWHELGEQLVMQHVAKGLIPLVHDAGEPPQIKINGVDRKTGRKWLTALKECLNSIGGDKLPHLIVEA
ncbi:hypothetical protein P3T73_11850 [Kiritimatiellota bacterium B12222]|nr:hypothetical protein P3T73_11850 [Kiritimatiellota bacterium B12222]